MRWLFPAVLCMVWAGAAAGQTVTVRSGEHEGFSRLVFGLPARMGYEVMQSDREARITFERRGLQWRTDSVFDRVPRDRLTALDAPDGKRVVVLSLGCDCDIDTFWHGAAYLVVDIRDPSGDPEDTAASAGGAPVTLPLTPPRERPGNAGRMVSQGLDGIPRVNTPEGEPGAGRNSLSESRDRLIMQIGRAASQGLLSPGFKMPSALAAEPAPEQVRAPPEPEVAESGPRPNLQLRAETSIDRDMSAVLMPGLGANGSIACLDPEQVDVSEWADERPFHEQLGPLRARLVGEFDKPDVAAVLGLARLYIHFGFGAEARQVLRELGDGATTEPVLSGMAVIVDTGHAGPVSKRSVSSLSAQMDCAPTTALWSALSYPELPADAPLDVDAILRGFSDLPVHLRAHLGPGLARRLAQAGYEEGSRRVRRILNRTPETVTPEAALLEAEVALKEEGEEAEAELETIVAGNAEPSAEALLRLIRHRLARDAEISYETAQLAGAYAHEHRGQPMGEELTAAYLSALAASGAFGEAFAELAGAGPNDAASGAPIRSVLVDLLTRRADDYEFLQYALAEADAEAAAPGRIDAETANAAATRLLALGFAEAAAAFATPDAAGDTGTERKLLRAEIALQQRRPRQAELALQGLTGAEANRLRAEARSVVGEHDAARRLFAGVGQEGEARREAWLAADWQTLAEDEDRARSEIARLKLNPPDAPEAEDGGVLARDRVLIDRSLETRDAVRALLEANPVPAD
ncbi:MAG: hypothetical protein RID23_11975 [Roseovarius sp.]